MSSFIDSHVASESVWKSSTQCLLLLETLFRQWVDFIVACTAAKFMLRAPWACTFVCFHAQIVTSAQAVCVLGSLSIKGGAQNLIIYVKMAWSEHLPGSSLRSRRLEAVGTRKNGRGRRRHARARSLFRPLLPSTCQAGYAGSCRYNATF